MQRAFDYALAVLLAGALAHSFVFYLSPPLTRPSADDYAEATAFVRGQFQPGDLIDLNPFWATRAREFLGDLPLQQYRRPEREELGPFRRLWLLSLFGAQSRPGLDEGLSRRGRLVDERQFGKIDLRLYALAPEPAPAFDFRAELRRAQVYVTTGALRLNCDFWDRDRWACPGDLAQAVAPVLMEIGGEPREVIWAHPIENGVKVLRWDDVPLDRTLSVRAGLRTAAVLPGAAPVEFSVFIDDLEVARWTFDNAAVWRREEVDTRAQAGSRHQVRFEVAAGRDWVRHFGFAAQVRP